MNYKEEYDKLIKFYQNHPISKKDGYCEAHHITPRSCGGLDNQNNLVNLPPDIHYKVHCYLPFIYLNEEKINEYHKMICAWKRLLNSSDERKILYNIDENAIEYKKLREEYAKMVGTKSKISQIGSKNSQYGTQWWKDPNDKTKSLKIKEGEPIPEGWVRGRWCNFSEEYKIKHKNFYKKYIGGFHITNGLVNKFISKNETIPDGFWKGITLSEEIRHKLSKSISESKRKKIEITKQNMIPIIREQYNYYKKYGWKDFCKKFNYTKSQDNFRKRFQYYLFGKSYR